MLKHVTVCLSGEDDAAWLAYECKDLQALRSIDISQPNGNFAIYDDLFRSLTNLERLHINYRPLVFISQATVVPQAMAPRKVLLQQIQGGAEWTRELVANGTNIDRHDPKSLRWYTAYSAHIWMRDIIAGRAFAARQKPPQVVFSMMMVFKTADEEILLKGTSFRPDTQIWSCELDGQWSSVKQKAIDVDPVGPRFGHGLLCDGSLIDDTTRQRFEEIIERPLHARERLSYAQYQGEREQKAHLAPVEQREDYKICLIANHLYHFNLRQEPCMKVLQFFESKHEPTLKLNSRDDLNTLLDNFGYYSTYTGYGSIASDIMALETLWEQRRVFGPFKNLIDLWRWMPVSPFNGHPRLWWRLFQALNL